MQKKILHLLKLIIKINCIISFFGYIDLIDIDLILNLDDNQESGGKIIKKKETPEEILANYQKNVTRGDQIVRFIVIIGILIYAY